MPPKQLKETIIFLINVGITNPNAEPNRDLVEKAKFIVRKLIEKKIFLRPNDEIGTIVMGSLRTQNQLSISNVEELCGLRVPNWELVESIVKLEATNYCCNWAEVIYAAIEYIKNEVDQDSMAKLVLLSDFQEDVSVIEQFTAEDIASDLSKHVNQLITITENSLDEKPSHLLTTSEQLLKDVHEKIDGKYMTYDDAMSDVKFYTEQSPKPMPWYCDLELYNKKFPITSYVKVTEAKKLRAWRLEKDNQNVETVREHLDRQRTTYDPEDIIKGYKYGGTFVPVRSEDEEAMKYNNGGKGYKILGFTKRENVGIGYWCSGTTRIVLPASEAVANRFYSLLTAMDECNLVAIVRKVYNSSAMPRMVALFPRINIPDEPWCLVEIEVPYAEDYRVVEPRPLNSINKQLSREQSQAVDDLIDSLTINESDNIAEDKDYFLPGSIPNPAAQNTWNMLAYRAINPEKPLPEMEECLKDLLSMPKPLIKKCQPHLKKIEELFQLENIEPDTKKRFKPYFKNMAVEQKDLKNDSGQTSKEENNIPSREALSKESTLHLDSSDVDLDELAANI
ncbi:hypothetical protein KM043_001175 [Ampulex compressa]|nr:hypothetical protein KM043_001175 [Ampulex compressa]